MCAEPRSLIRLYIDEDVHESIAPALRQRGYDALNVREVNRRGLSDPEQLAYAVAQSRTLFSFNVSDYMALHVEYVTQNREHKGIIVSKQIPISAALRRLLILLEQTSANEIHNQLHWLPSL
jgi:predicted nuclease of predicted toxin-antitoxin system